MLQAIKDFLYSLIIESGFLFKIIFPLLRRNRHHLFQANHNHVITDDGGSTIITMKINGKVYFPLTTRDKLAAIKNYRVRDSDILISGYPKTGCHWVYEILYMLVNNSRTISDCGKELGGMIEAIPEFIFDCVPSPRVLSSHLLYDELPDQVKTKRTKIVLTVRCPKDTVVSYYNHYLKLKQAYRYEGKFENFFKLFMAGRVDFESYFDYILDWDRVVSTSHPVNEVFVLNFNELKRDPVAMIKRLARFLEVDTTHEFAAHISETTSFSAMKKTRSSDPFTHRFLRKGVAGDWKNWLTDAQEEEMNRKWKEVESKLHTKLSLD